MRVVYCCWVFSLNILFRHLQVESRYNEGNRHRGESFDEFINQPDSAAAAKNGHKTPSVSSSSDKFSLDQKEEDTSTSGEHMFEPGKLKLDTASSGNYQVTEGNQVREHASNVKQSVYLLRKTHARSHKADVYKKHSITQARQVHQKRFGSTEIARAVNTAPVIKKDFSVSNKKYFKKKNLKRNNEHSKIYKKYNLALFGAAPAQTVGYVPVGGVLQTAAYLPATQGGLNNLRTSTSGGIISQLPNSGVTGSSMLPQLPGNSLAAVVQGGQSQSQPSVSSYAAKNENSGNEQVESLSSEQFQTQLGTNEPQDSEQNTQQAVGQNIQEQQMDYQQQPNSQQATEGNNEQGLEETNSLSDLFGSNTQQNEGTLAFSNNPNSQSLSSLDRLTSQFTEGSDGASRVTSDEEHVGTAPELSKVINIGSDGSVSNNVSPDESQAQEQTTLIDENDNQNMATTSQNYAEPGVESPSESSGPGKDTTQGGSETGNDATVVTEPGSEGSRYVAYAADQPTNVEESKATSEQDTGNSLLQDEGSNELGNTNSANSNDNGLHSSTSSMFSSKVPGVDDETLNVVNMAINSPVTSCKP